MGNCLNCVTCNSARETETTTPDSALQNGNTSDERLKIKSMVLESLSVIRTYLDQDQEPPQSILSLHALADQKEGWIQLFQSMIEVIPLKDPLGPAIITLLLEECPLHSTETINKLFSTLKLQSVASKANLEVQKHKNTAVVIGCIAEKLAGSRSVEIFKPYIINYLLNNLSPSVEPPVILFSMIALEKFCQASENKRILQNHLVSSQPNPIQQFESWFDHEHFVQRQIGVVSQWFLDNLLPIPGRLYSYENANTENINVMLNTNDVSECLKISPDGLEARCDAHSFESVRCTFEINEGVWFYEVMLITAGVMQIGWATKNSKFLNYEGYGIGDDEYSIAYDGCRRLVWNKAANTEVSTKCWKPGDVIGFLLDCTKREVTFYSNGQKIKTYNSLFKSANSGFFAAASFMSFQQCRFNFGATPFKYPPKKPNYKVFNDNAFLSPEQKKVLPRPMKLELLKNFDINENSCTLCFDNFASVKLYPCDHEGFCKFCAKQLECCPMCRAPIEDLKF